MRLGIGFDPLGTPQSRLKRHRPLFGLQAGAHGERSGALDALRAVATGEDGTFGTLAAIIGFQAMRAGRIRLAQMPLRQTVIAQQKVVERLFQVRLSARNQRIKVLRLVEKRLQYRQLNVELSLTNHPPRLFDDGGRGAVSELWIQRSQSDLPDALPCQFQQRALNGQLAIAHRQFHGALFPVRADGVGKALTEHYQW